MDRTSREAGSDSPREQLRGVSEYGLAWFAACLVWLLASAAQAQVPGVEGFGLDTLWLPPTPQDGIALQTPSTLPHLHWSAHLLVDYAHQPLVSAGHGTAESEEVVIVDDRVRAQAAFALGLYERGELFLRVPAVLFQRGDSPPAGGIRYPEPRTGGLGEISLGGSARLFGDDEGFSSGAHGSVWLPSGSQRALSGDGQMGARAGLSLQYKARATALAFESGAHLRPRNRYGTLVSGSQWYYRAGMHVWLTPAWKLMFELDGAMRITDGQAFEPDQNAFEGLGAIRYGLGRGLYVTVGAGLGLLSMAGTPLGRGFFGVGFRGGPLGSAQQQKAQKP